MTKHDQKHELIKAVLLATSVGTSVFSIGLAYAGGPITQLNTSTTGATLQTYTGSDANTYNWGQGTDVHFDGFQFSGNSYVPVFLADDVTIRRVDATTTPANGNIKATGLACGIFAESTSTINASPFNLTTTYPEDSVGNGNCDMEAMVGGDIISRGGLDVFDNDDDIGTYKKAKNIERVDFIFTGGITAPALVSNLAESGHIVTEKSGNNPVQIAAILSLDGTGNPASYGTLLTVDQSSNSPDVAYGLYNSIAKTHFEFLSNDPLAATKVFPIHIQFSNEFLGSAFVTLDQLGVGTGVTYFGFSYFPADVDTGLGHILTDPSTFPPDTAGDDGDADMYGGTSGYFTLLTLANFPPDAVDDSAQTNENSNVNINVLNNDSDPDGDNLTLSIDTQASNGTATVNDNGTPAILTDDTIDYLPNANFTGTDTFVYQVDDGNAANGGLSTDTATVTITVNGAPTATNDTASTSQGNQVNIDVLNNDSDPETDPLTLSITANGSNGNAVVNNNGTPALLSDDTIDYTPNAAFTGTDTFTYQVDDGNGGTDTATVTVTVNGTPTATNDTASTSQGNLVNIDVLNNDSDPETDPLTLSVTANGSNGNAIVNNNGTPAVLTDDTIDYTPNAAFTGTDTFTYQIDDGNGGTDTATVTVTVSAPNGTPTATNDTASTGQGTLVNINVLSNDSDPETDPLTLTVTANGSNGNAVVNNNGTPAVLTDDTIDYTPNAAFTGSDTFTYQVDDGNGGTDTATVTVTVNGTPTAVNDTAATSQGNLVNINVLNNDSDPETDPLTLTVTANGSNGNAVVNNNGTPAVLTDDTIDYTPNAAFTGSDTFTYQIDDGNGGTDTATVTVTINGTPTAVNDTASTSQGNLVNIDALNNDSDPETDPLTLSVTANASNGNAVVNNNGTPAVLTDDTIDYTPNAAFIGTDTFTYQVDDGNGGTDTATVTVTISSGNTAPTAVNDTASSIGNLVNINVLNNDSDPETDPLTLSVTANGSNGNAIVNNNGTPAVLTDDTIDYTPNVGFTGTDTFTYQVDDGNGGTDTATVTVSVDPNDFDGDGINDSIDIDDDNDGIPDSVEGTGDFDNDGIPNHQDLDADGDGILDLAETGLTPAEIATLDTDGDGEIDSGNSFGANGLADPVETVAESGAVDYDNNGVADNPANHDTDLNPDFLDLDSDNDGVTDVIEAGQPDSDGNGFADTGHTPVISTPDTDGDGVPDVHDLDSDNDGITDTIEAGLSDTDGDGLVDGFIDSNGDGFDDSVAASPTVLPDTDNDGIPDIHDLDSDNDGITDTIEAGLSDTDGDGHIDGFTDADGDGYDDAVTTTPPSPLPDTDNDGVPDVHDLDSDNDGITDTTEAGLSDGDNDGRIDNFTDVDGDGYDDNVAAAPASPLPDTDADTTPDVHDLDSDNDGDTDTNEAGLSDTNDDGLIDGFTDTNGDGYDDNLQGLKPTGKVRTGLDAVGGCAIDTDAKFDPMMPLLMLFALLYLLRNATVSGQRPGVVARRALGASILGITAMSASTASTAQEEQDEFKSGLYVGAGVGFSHVKPDTDKTAFEVDEEIDFGWKVFLGYDYSKRISFEAHYADLGEATLKPQGSVDYSVYGLSGLYRFGQKGDNEKNDLFTRQGMSYYGKVGVGKMDNEGNNVDFHRVNDVHLFFGLGAEYGYKNGIAVRFEADLYDEDAQFFSISLIKRFRKRTRHVANIAPVVVAEQVSEIVPVQAPAPAYDCQINFDTVLSSGAILFRTNRADLAPQSHALLDELAAVSLQCADAQIEIGGHTDSLGKASYNMNLSQQRAEAVLRYLQAASVSADNLSAVGYGETQPVAKNTTREGRANNRRIEFTVK